MTGTNQPRAGAAVALAAALCAGCATNNFDFARVADDTGRGAQLKRELDRLDGDDGLLDATYIPLAHLDLHLYTESDADEYPGGHVEADVVSYLPLFGFVDAKLVRYDERDAPYESHEFDSYLWGLFNTHREELRTTEGLRRHARHRLLWFLRWSSGPEYVTEPSPGDAS